jgi:hypothetical protein
VACRLCVMLHHVVEYDYMYAMVRTQVQLTKEQVRELKRLADRHSASVAEMVRRAIDELLARQHEVSRAELKQRALAVAGRYRSGRSDISRHHDDYLAEAFDT